MTGRPLARGAVLLAALVLSVLVAGAAAATPRGDIFNLQESPGSIKLVFAADGLASGDSIDPESLTASLDGEDLPATAQLASQSSDIGRRVAVLAIDVSGSMAGPGIAGAKEAARTFVSQAPDDVAIGLVAFSDKAKTLLLPTVDKAQVLSDVEALQAGGGTALFAGVSKAVGVTGAAGLRSVIVLSDGAEDGSSGPVTLPKTTAQIRASKVKVDAVSLGTNASQISSLRRLAVSGGGRVIAAGAANQLTGFFQQAAQNLTNQVVVTITVPPRYAGRSGNLTIAASAGKSSVSDVSFVHTVASARSSAPAQDVGPKPVHLSGLNKLALNANARTVSIGLVFLGLVVMLALVLLAGTKREGKSGRVDRRLAVYTLTGRRPVKKSEQTSSSVLGDSAVARSALELAGRVVQQRGFEEKLALRLERSGLPLRPAEWILIHAGTTLSLGLVLFLLRGSVVALVLGLVLGGLLPLGYLTVKESRRTREFLSQLPDSLQLLAGSLQAGYSLPQGIDTIVREGQQPISGELNRVLVEARLGAPIEDALEGVAERMASKDFAWVVMAIRIQREVGGNLAEVLTTVAATLREREFLRRHVKALSAEGVLSAWILCLLPPGFMLYLTLVRPEYLKPLITDFFGLVLLGTAGFLMAAGIFWMRKVIKVEV